ncbi:glycerophosphodiester phosphodiesterase [Dermatobacter hominis]|uniref:glycerophosphodiester phosphodiesterase n=1 Tax=Dermatobacter hominis TaxID=2884263 RepID=UPI001D1245B3|nr:glycerophosphodiester phosphodiesterase [Dermatobacter hominis]UDY36443.1 glycerophosphodiester phosphodiesterase [Dermatobacter hominis]
MSRYAFLDGPTPFALAHRGGDEVAPENTARAFAAAVDAGYRYLETDVHVSADGELFAFHDDVLDRVTDRTGAVAAHTAAELREVRIGGTDPIPTLDELLGAFPDVRWNIDPKSDGAVIALARALRRHDAVDRVNIGAFSDERLARVRALLGPDLCTAGGPREVAALLAASRVPVARRRGRRPRFGCVQVPIAYRNVTVVTQAFVDAAHARDVQVHVWTVDEPAEAHRLLDLGVDALITDKPTVMRKVLEHRGAWR